GRVRAGGGARPSSRGALVRGAGARVRRSAEGASRRLRGVPPMRPPTRDHEPTSRREFLRRTGTVVAASGLGLGCTQDPPEHVVPAARAPERSPAGTPLHFA